MANSFLVIVGRLKTGLMAGVFLPVVTICRPLLPLAAEKKYKKKEHKEKGMQSNDVKEIGVNYRMFFFFCFALVRLPPVFR